MVAGDIGKLNARGELRNWKSETRLFLDPEPTIH
jgi:hypothetical protein